MKNPDIIRLGALMFIAATLACILLVMTVDLIAHPEQALPAIVTTVLGTILGFALHYLGWDGGLAGSLTQSPPPSSVTKIVTTQEKSETNNA